MELEILYQDEYLVAINKPHGLLVHRSKYADEVKVFAVQELRNQIGKHVWPCHRLDRKTSGVLIFALNEEVNSKIQQQFAQSLIDKTYVAIVRGFTPEQDIINYPLINEKGKQQEAVTHYKTLKKCELDLPFGKHLTSRYSLVEIKPQTGRLHQIRKHFAHIFHPIIADRPHGCNKQNKLFKEKFNLTTMLLHAIKIEFNHPITNETIRIEAELQSEFKRIMQLMNW